MYGDSHALSSDSSPIFSSNPKQKREQQLPFMESEYRQQFGCNNSSQNSSGLLRFRSAPTSLLENLTEKSSKLGFSRFGCGETNGMNVAEHEDEDDDGCNEGSGNRFGAMNTQLPPQYPRQSGAQMGYRVVSSIGRENEGQSRIGSNLMRQNSSPAGFLSHLNSQNGYYGGRGIGSYRGADGGGNGSDLSPCSSRLKSRMNLLSRITEVENENGGPNGNGLDEAKVGNSSGDNLFFSSGFPFGSWNDSSYFAENMSSGIKRELLDNDPKLFLNNTHERSFEGGNNMLSHHLSLPKTSAEMEKLLQLQDTVPCKVRAKRGCATHPRSIAERVRRTRISERMRKLQELVPNMDKQTNTADMLDLAVDYIKGLQKQYKTLNDIRENCECSAFPKC